MALTFGTLLSSQGADAQRTRPSRASSLAGVVLLGARARPRGRSRRREKVTWLEPSCQTGCPVTHATCPEPARHTPFTPAGPARSAVAALRTTAATSGERGT